MSKSLASAKSSFENDIYNVLKDALYNAYMTQYNDNVVEEASKFNIDVQNKMKEVAINFSEEAAKKASKGLADAIYNYIKEMAITINHIPKGTLISPAGPVTGTINVSPNEVTII